MVICTDGEVRQYLMEVSFYKVKSTLPSIHTYMKHTYEVI